MWIGWAAWATAAEPSRSWTVGPFRDLEVADFDGDGIDDLAWTEVPGGLWVALGPDLTPVLLPTVAEADYLGAADLDADGAADLMVTGQYNAGQVHRGGPGGPSATEIWTIPFSSDEDPRSLGDIDGNGYEDATTGRLLLGGPDGPDMLANFSLAYRAGALDGDGFDDLFFMTQWGLDAVRGAPGGTSELLWSWSTDEEAARAELVVLDVDGDGADELAFVQVMQGNDGHASAEGHVAAMGDISGPTPVILGQSRTWTSLDGHSPRLAVLDGQLLVGFDRVVSDLVLVDGALVAGPSRWPATPPFAVLLAMDSGDLDGDGDNELVVGWHGLSEDSIELYDAPSAPEPPETNPGEPDPPDDTGAAPTEDPPATADPPATDASRCGCGTSDGASGWALVGIGAWLLRRRPPRRGRCDK